MKKDYLFLVFAFLLLPILTIAQRQIAIGDILCTDGTVVGSNDYAASGKTALGIVFYVDDSGQHGWAVHLEYQGEMPWCHEYIDIPNLQNYRNFRDAIKDIDGYSNTRAIRNHGTASLFPAAWAVDFDNGWYLPAAGQIRQLYGYIPEINMTEGFAHVKTGQVTFAVRDTSIDGVEIHKDDYMALAEGKIILSTPEMMDAAKKVLEGLMDEDSEIVTIIYGEDATAEQADALQSFIEENYPDAEVEIVEGKQSLYPFILSVE